MKTNLPSRRQTLCNLSLAAAMAPFAGSPFLRALGKEPKLSLNQAIADSLTPFIDSGELAGVVAATGTSKGLDEVVCRGKADLASGRNMTPDSLFRIASMTKPMTALSVMQVAQAGKLKPSDLLAKHLEEFSGGKVKSKDDQGKSTVVDLKNPPTLAHLLSHTSGIPAYPKSLGDVYGTRKPSLAEAVKGVAAEPLDFVPGSKWAYCNPGIDTLGRVVEVAFGQEFADCVVERILKPLGMNDTLFFPSVEARKKAAFLYERKEGKLNPVKSWAEPPPGALHPMPAGGLWSTALDMAKLCVHMLGLIKGSIKDGILAPALAKDMILVKTGDLKSGFTEGMGFGYGWAVVRKNNPMFPTLSLGTFGHGGAFGTQYWIDPVKDRFTILMIQRVGLSNGDASPMRVALHKAVG